MSLNKLNEIMSNIEFKSLGDSVSNELLAEVRKAREVLGRMIEADDAKKAGKGWTKGEGNIFLYHPDGTKGLGLATVYRNKEIPGLFIHRGIDKDGLPTKTWTITHEKSGLSILGGYKNMKKAALIITTYFAGLNWNIDPGEIHKHPELSEAYKQAKNAA